MKNAAFVLTMPLGLAACSDVCRNTPHQIVDSTDGTSRVVLFDRDCGATTGFTTQVSLVDLDEQASGKGNVFVADKGTNAAAWGGPWADVRWIGPKHLLVRFDATARVFVQNKTVNGVRVSFQPMSR